MLNSEKLSLDPATAVGTQVSVSDGFYVSGAGNACNGFWTLAGGGYNGRSEYAIPSDATGNAYVYWDNGLFWAIYDTENNLAYTSDDDVAEPWLVTTWSESAHSATGVLPLPTFTHPALQQYAAASTSQGGVFVAGGTGEAVYFIDGSEGGKPAFTAFNDINNAALYWSTDRWLLPTDIDSYYSLSDVATPDLATDWKNASDDTPASITVTSVSAGELAAGISSVDLGATYQVNGSLNGRKKYTDVLALVPDVTWTLDAGGQWVNGGTPLNLGNVAFPWQGTPEFAVTKSNVAAEENWDATPTEAPAITSADHTTFMVGNSGSFTVTATGVPTPTLSEDGALPTGVTFVPETGVLSGTPAAGTAGTYPITFTASNGVGSDAVQSFTLTVTQTAPDPCHLTCSRGFCIEFGFKITDGFRPECGFTPSNGF